MNEHEIEIIDMQLVEDQVNLTDGYQSRGLTAIKESSNEYSKSKSTINQYKRQASTSYLSAVQLNSELKKSSS